MYRLIGLWIRKGVKYANGRYMEHSLVIPILMVYVIGSRWSRPIEALHLQHD